MTALSIDDADRAATAVAFPPGLSMLWESDDASEAFTSRFGFADYGDGVAWLGAGLAERWGLTLQRCERILISDVNAIAWVDTAEAPFRLICKWSASVRAFEKLAAVNDLIASLGELGIPVASPVAARNGTRRSVIDGPSGPLSVSVQPLVDGTPLDMRDAGAVEEAGASLARLHIALADLSDGPVRQHALQPNLDLAGRIRGLIRGRSAASTAQTGSPDLGELLERDVAALPRLESHPQLVHNDYRAANLVTTASTIHAILDFDDVAWDHPLSDLAHTGVYLGTLFHDWGPTSAAARQRFVEGYASVTPLTRADRQWLAFLTRWYSIATGWPVEEA